MSHRFAKLGEIADTSSGGTPQRGVVEYYGGNIPWVKSGELPDGLLVKTEETITTVGLANSSAKLLPAGTLLLAMYGATVGKLGILGVQAATNQAVCAITPRSEVDRDFLFYWLLNIRNELISASFGGAQPNISQSVVQDIDVPLLSMDKQRRIAIHLHAQLSAIEELRRGTQMQITEFRNLTNAVIRESVGHHDTKIATLGDVLDEVKRGVGRSWADYPVLGATRNGLAPAKDPVGKSPERYKPVIKGTVFYNPMLILIGSIAMVDEGDTPGITSPDYVVLRGRETKVDSRWFYFWLRSSVGEQCIASLARGAVRERMLFTRLAEGKISLPPFAIQQRASKVLAQIRPMLAVAKSRLKELDPLPSRLLAHAFEDSGA